MKKIAIPSYSPVNTGLFYSPVLCLGKKLCLLTLFIFWFFKGYSQTPIDLSRPVGMTEGVAGSNGGGAATYSIPIDLPAGIGGYKPSVSISYSSQGGGNGFCGHGWSLAPISMINRGGKNTFHDGISTPVNYTSSNDAFILDGQRLMLKTGNYGASGSTYGTEQEGFSEITSNGVWYDAPETFDVKTKDGTLLSYGANYAYMTTYSGYSKIFWFLSTVTDALGNIKARFEYNIDHTDGAFYLSQITYSNYKVVFNYSTKTDWNNATAYISGERINSKYILDRIDVKKYDNTPIRSYNLSYQYRHKKYFLSSVTETGADGTALNPITFSYGENTGAQDIAISATQSSNLFTNQNATGDFDGDGRQDVLTFGYSQYSSNNNNEIYFKKYAIREFDGSSVNQLYYYHIDTDVPGVDVRVVGKVHGQGPYTVTDFDGDGKDDVVLAKFNGSIFRGLNINYSRVNAVNGVYHKKMVYDNLPSSLGETYNLIDNGRSYFIPGDFDGDGAADYILITSRSPFYNEYKAFLSTPSKNLFNQEILGFGVGVNGATGPFAASRVSEAKTVIPINFDGDGKTELLVVRDEGSYVIRVSPVPSSSGYSYGSEVLYSTTDIKKNYSIYPGDFNGDGNTDLLVRPPGRYDQWKIFTNTGKAFSSTNFNFNQLVTLADDATNYHNFLAVGDYDGDGKTDIWHSGDMDDGLCHHFIYYSNGTSFTSETFVTSPTQNTQHSAPVGDFNGDGKLDFLKINEETSTTFWARYIMPKPFKEQNLLTGVSNLGHLTNFDYGLLNNKDNSQVYSRTEGQASVYDLSDPTPHVPNYIVPAPSMYVVSQIRRPNGIGSQFSESYKYANLIVHPSGRGFLGFKKQDVVNDNMGTTSSTLNGVNLNYSMLYPELSETQLNVGSIITRSRYSTSFRQVSSSAYSNRRFFLQTNRIHTKNWLTNEGTEILNTYDDYGNVTQNTTNAGNSDDYNISLILETATTTTSYATYAGAPYPGFPISVAVSKTRTSQPTVSTTTNYTYTPQGLIETVTENVGTPIASTVTNIYNGFGSVTQTSMSAPGVTTPVTEYIYDPWSNLLLEKKITGDGITKKTTYTYDDRWVLPLTVTSTDGLTTSYVYNTFGELTQTNFPDGNSLTTTRSWETAGNARMSSLTQRADGSAPVKVYIDILGREIKTEKRGFSNQWLTSIKSYNSLGQLYSETAPYYPGEPTNSTTYTYDSYGRPNTTSNATGTITTTYNNSGGSLNVHTSNLAGQTTIQTTDASGKITLSSKNGNAMIFSYDSWGNQLDASSVAAGYTFLSNGYDNYGRKTSTFDINIGTLYFQYNSIGQLVQQTDENGVVQNITYDAFGRTATKYGVQGITTYSYYYDAATGRSNDNISLVTGFDGDVRQYWYDGLQRLSSETITANGSSLTKTYGYNSRGQLATTIYPAGFTIRDIYDDNDIPIQTQYEYGAIIKNLFTATSMNSRGIYTGYTKTNGKASIVYYDFAKEMVNRYNTVGVQDLNLIYEVNTDNLVSRTETYKGLSETFTYDINDKLKTAAVNGLQQFSIDWHPDGGGRIMQKTGVGNYVYDYYKGYILRSLSPIGSEPDPNLSMGPMTYNLNFTAFKMPQTITHNNGHQLTYSYGSNEQRLTSELKYGATTVENRSYWDNMEGITKAGISYEVYYISAGNGLNNMIVKQGAGIDIYDVYTDQLGSLVALTNEAGAVVAEQNFDAWGRKRNPNDWTFAGVPTAPDWLIRGFTGHEQIAEMGLVNMNARMYDPATGQMLAPDNYISDPWSFDGYNRFTYANGNPLSYIDPDGNHPIVVAAIIGAAVGAYMGGTMANDGNFNPTKWDYSNGKTWSWMAGGAIVGGASGALGGFIASSSVPFANTLSIGASSLVNSAGTNLYTGGQTDVLVSLGIASFNFSTGTFGYLGKKGNSWAENLGYAFGAMANIQDAFALTSGTGLDVKARRELAGHSEIKGRYDKKDILISVGPKNGGPPSTETGMKWEWGFFELQMKGTPYAGENVSYIRNFDPERGTPIITRLNNVNGNLMLKWTNKLSSGHKLLGNSKLVYGLNNGCVNFTSRALLYSGVVNFNAFLPLTAPVLLNYELIVRNAGMIASPILINHR